MKKEQDSRKVPVTDVTNLGRRTIYQRLHLISLGKGICIALALVLLSVPLGNWRALQSKLDEARRVWDGLEVDGKKIPAAQQTPISQIIEGRAAAASNLLTIMKRYPGAAVAEREALERARNAMRGAGDPASAERANEALSACVSEGMDALFAQTNISDDDHAWLEQVAASFNEQGRKLFIRARDYNRQMQKAIDAYDEMPASALFARPALFRLPPTH